MKFNRTPKQYFLLYLKGLSMGAADVVPGVSGGTIAFITGIYEELIHSIKSAGNAAKTHLLKGRIVGFIDAINGDFLFTLLAGIATSILLLSKLVLFLLENQPIAIWSFFFGLIIASAIIVYKKIKVHHIGIFLVAIFGAVIAYWITVASPTETTTDLWFIFVCGAIAICAMILPGISGSFILLLLGKYEYILTALKDMKVGIILTFIAGCITGISLFAHVLDWLLKRYHDIAVGLLAGFMIGSLNKVWPWKEIISTRINSKGQVVPLLETNISPLNYLDVTGKNPEILTSLVLCLVGFLVVYLLELKGNKMPHSEK